MERTDRARGQTHSSRCLFIEQSTRSFFFFKALQPPSPFFHFLCAFFKKETYFGVVCTGVAALPSSCEVHSTRDGVPVTLVDSSLSGRG